MSNQGIKLEQVCWRSRALFLDISSLRDLDQPLSVLSGGERQSVAISRACFFGAQLMLMDERVAALSVKETNKVLGSMRAIASQCGFSSDSSQQHLSNLPHCRSILCTFARQRARAI